jgi:hypothetical protein
MGLQPASSHRCPPSIYRPHAHVSYIFDPLVAGCSGCSPGMATATRLVKRAYMCQHLAKAGSSTAIDVALLQDALAYLKIGGNLSTLVQLDTD